MGKLSNPALFSTHFGRDPAALDANGVFDPILNADTPLFIDPLLLEHSAASTFAKASREQFVAYFNTVIGLIVGSKAIDDAPWRAAERKLRFPEVPYTCLGYGAATVRGSGGGTQQTAHLVRTAAEIIELGITDPDLFVAMALIEEGIGPDRISDMTTKIVLPALINYTTEVCNELGIATQQLTVRLRNGDQFSGMLPVNTFLGPQEPLVLMPRDVLRQLPIATDWASVSDAASQNAAFRQNVNENIAAIWTARSRESKSVLREWALSDDATFQKLLDLLQGVEPTGYDFASDPAGEIFWRNLLDHIDRSDLGSVQRPLNWTIDSVVALVEKIIETFRHLVEDRRLSEELYHDGKPRAEKAAQRLFFVTAHAFCKANDLDVTPEADTGNGPVDFKFSAGFSTRVLVEIKLSTNGKVVAGYTRQLETYATAEEASAGFYVIVDVGHMGDKLERLLAIKNELAAQGKPTRPIVVIDANRRPSASKL